MRPYTRSLHPDDYAFLPHAESLRVFERDMVAHHVPHREWHQHRFWEYASIMQQLEELGVPADAEMIDVGAGASFFDPYLALRYPRLCCTDSMKYGDVTLMVAAQRAHYGVSLPLYDLPLEDMSARSAIGWGGAEEKFDVTLCISTIEHVDDHDTAFHELVRITKPGGYIFITSDYFRDIEHSEQSVSRHLQVTPYSSAYVLSLPKRFAVDFVGETDLNYLGDFVHNYSFCNVCLRKKERMTYLKCDLSQGQETWQPEPFPGSEVARKLGCLCPFEQPWPGSFLFASDCLVHELVSVEQTRPVSTGEITSPDNGKG